MNRWQSFKSWAMRLKRDVAALGLALFVPRTPWPARALSFFIVVYALSPIDLIPDVIPVLGLLDELILLPLLIALAIRLIPAAMVADCRARVDQGGKAAPMWLGRVGLAVIVAIWLAVAVTVARWLWPVGGP